MDKILQMDLNLRILVNPSDLHVGYPGMKGDSIKASDVLDEELIILLQKGDLVFNLKELLSRGTVEDFCIHDAEVISAD